MGEVEVENANGDAKKTEVDSSLDEVIHEKIIAQLEYYFSDNNLSRDKFMQQQIKLDEGWLPLELLMKFKRLAAIVGDRDKSILVDAVKKSTLLEVNSDGDKIRRNAEHPLPEEYEELRKSLMTRTIYCKGFPLENITFDDLLEFFKSHGKIESVIMRHYMDRATKQRGFKGSTFVTFPTVEDAEAFLKIEDLKYKDNPLLVKWQSVYIDDKRKERLEDKLKNQERRRENKKSNKRKNENDDKEKEDKDNEREGFPLGAVVNLTGFKEGSKIHRDLIREAIESAGQSVSFIDFNPGDPSGIVRMDTAGAAAKLIEKLKEENDGKLKVDDEDLEVRILEGEEEANYLDRARKEINKRRQNNKSNKRGRHRGGRGGFGDRGRKRKGGPMEDAPAAKTAAVE